MAKLAVTAMVVTVGAVNYDAQIDDCNIEIDVDVPDVTNMDSAGWKEFIGALKSYMLNIGFVQDSDLSGLHTAIMAALGTSIAWTAKLTSAATSASNVQLSGNVIVNKWGLGGKVGDRFGRSVSWQGTGAIATATS
jgi:hypothetical protein